MTDTIDGTPIEEVIRIGEGGAYERIGILPEKRERYVLYCSYDGEVCEEIDVNATDAADARIIGSLAILWHYDEGVKIASVKHIPRGMMYF
jgi:hypothetical protein